MADISSSSEDDSDDETITTTETIGPIAAAKIEQESRDVPSQENLCFAQDKFIQKSLDPLHQASKTKNASFPSLGRRAGKLFSDGGPIMSNIAKRTGIRASLHQPPYHKFFKDKHIELLGMIAKTMGLQTGAIITMLCDLVLMLLAPDAVFDTKMGYIINFNLLRMYIGNTCSHKSRLMKFVFHTAMKFLKEQGIESGLFTGDFTNANLLKEMADRFHRRLLIIDEEVGLKFRKVRKCPNRGSYEQLRGSFNVLHDGDGLEVVDDENMDEMKKFGFVGATQVLPCLEFLQDEKVSDCAMTKKMQLSALPIGQETGDFGPDLDGVSLENIVEGITYQAMSVVHEGDPDLWGWDEEATEDFGQYIEEKEENQRDVNEKYILEALEEEPVTKEVDENFANDRDEKFIIQRSVAYKFLNHIFDTADAHGTFFVKGSRLSHVVGRKYLQQAIVTQQVFNRQRKEIMLTLETLENAAGNCVTLKQADNLIRLQRKTFNFPKEVLKCSGWFTPLEYIVRLKRREKIKKTELNAQMCTMSRPFGSYDFCGRFISLRECKVFVKAHPIHVEHNYLTEIDMSMEQYETAFYEDMDKPTKYWLGKPNNWKRFVDTMAKLYPKFDSNSVWFERFRSDLILQKGQDIYRLKYLAPVEKQHQPVARKELKKCEQIRGLEICTVSKRKNRVRNRISIHGVIRQTVRHNCQLAKKAFELKRDRKVGMLIRQDAYDPEVTRTLDKYDRKIRVLEAKALRSLSNMTIYRQSQRDLLIHLEQMEDEEKRENEYNEEIGDRHDGTPMRMASPVINVPVITNGTPDEPPTIPLESSNVSSTSNSDVSNNGNIEQHLRNENNSIVPEKMITQPITDGPLTNTETQKNVQLGFDGNDEIDSSPISIDGQNKSPATDMRFSD